jgi:hypothetical protein
MEILLFPDRNDKNDQDIVMDKNRRPVFTDPEPVPGHQLRGVHYLHDIAALVRIRGKPFLDKVDPNANILWERCQIFSPAFLNRRKTYFLA